MCGIYCCVAQKGSRWRKCNTVIDCKTQELLKRRGPDQNSSCDFMMFNWLFCFESHILWMQGNEPTVQPVKDDHGNLLLWNGDILSGVYEKSSVKNKVSDTFVLLQALVENESSPVNVLDTMTKVYGPWSMIYWNQTRKTLWFGRDVLGRHSLLWTKSESGIVLSSVSKRRYDEDKYQEVPAIGLFSMDFSANGTEDELPVPYLHLWNHLIPANISLVETPVEEVLRKLSIDISHNFQFSISQYAIKSPIKFESRNNGSFDEQKCVFDERILINPPLDALNVLTDVWFGIESILERFIDLLKAAVKSRVHIQPGLCKDCIKDISKIDEKLSCHHSKICVLFSGGLDSTVLALLSDTFVPDDEPIDLLNVAFASDGDGTCKERKDCSVGEIPDRLQKSMFVVPDRKTGRLALAELKTLLPNRKWNFIEIDVHTSELREIRKAVITDLINPLNTVLDDSLGCAMWFAARGQGTISAAEEMDGQNHRISYSSPARVALLGTGADEQLGGYSRHRSALEDGGWSLLAQEMEKQVRNLPSRNLGRDDRICSDHGRQPRFPFLDEDVVSFLNSLFPWQKVAAHVDNRKVNERNKQSSVDQTVPLTLRPGVGDKALLRLAALKLGLKEVCSFPKRAMQFGSRIAKLEGKEKANDVCQRLMSSKIYD